MATKSKQSTAGQLAVPVELIERRIYLIRGHKVMLDSELAELYQAPTKAPNQAVRRNLTRFPPDVMFQLSSAEADSLRSQFVTSNVGRGGRRYLRYAFTEQGVAMLSSVLNSERAVQVNTFIMRTFVKLREVMATHKDLARELEDLKRTSREHDAHIRQIYTIIEKLLEPPPEPPKRQIGFRSDSDK